MMVAEMDESAIAVVGMSGRFPGAGSVRELWNLLRDGREAPADISREELIAAGVDKALIDHPDYVRRRMRIDGPDLFDADFFGYSPRQAASLDPQQRVFLECAWEAIEAAGYDLAQDEESVGVFAGSSYSDYFFDTLLRESGGSSAKPSLESILDTDKDFLTSRVAYKLGLTGPSITVQTACSTSLVAVHLACQSLLNGECDLALAGGVRIAVKAQGYRYMAHGIGSPDGHCRAFDAEAKGTVPGSGAAVVVLRRFADALEGGYQIHAVIKATVVNNDGSQKVGFTAPGLNSQRQLFARGLVLADLRPGDIGYMEAHGTGTVLGDSIELTALKDVYGKSGKLCALGSIKTNIGHLDTAAGVAGLIKAILCLKNKALVPSLGFVTPNPILQEQGCPFYVNTAFRPWQRDSGRPLRAAVSSFGLGGTNAQAILEEAPERTSSPNGETAQVLPLSARTPEALDRAARNLVGFLETNAEANVGDVAFTLQMGRKKFACRRAVVGHSASDLAAALREPQEQEIEVFEGRPVVFLFPWEGSQRAGMARNLYRTENSFREQLDQCAERVKASLGYDIRRFLCDAEPDGDSGLLQTAHLNVALFCLEYCLARLWMSWSIMPNAMFGHGQGELVAAAIAEVIPVNDAIDLVVYSSSPAPAAADLKRLFSTLKIASPRLRYISGATGEFVSSGQVRDVSYWGKHLLNPVRCSQALDSLRDLQGAIFLEVGPVGALSAIAREQFGADGDQLFLPSLQGSEDRAQLLRVLGRMWSAGATVDWSRMHAGQARLRVELPTYPFERQSYVHDSPATVSTRISMDAPGDSDLPSEKRFFLPSWKASLPLAHWSKSDSAQSGLWLVLEDKAGFGAAVTKELRAAGCEVISVCDADRYNKTERDGYLIDPQAPDDYLRWISELKKRGRDTWRIIHCWSLGAKEDGEREDEALAMGYRSLLFLTQALASVASNIKVSLVAATTALFDPGAERKADAAQGAIPAICTVAAQELTSLRCAVVDLPAPGQDSILPQPLKGYVDAVLAEVLFSLPDPIVACRGSHRLVRSYEPVQLDWSMPKVRSLREKGVYLITGGLGRIGLILGEELARSCQARLVLATRSPFPERSEWEGLLVQSTTAESVVGRIQAVRRMEEAGAKVSIAVADVSNEKDVQRVLADVRAQFGELNGVFHLAGELSHESANQPIAKMSRTGIDTQARPKVAGFQALDRALRDQEVDFGVTFSSNASILGGAGFGAYAAANAIADHMALARKGEDRFPWIVINWDGWLTYDMAAAGHGEKGAGLRRFLLSADEGMDALWRIICLATAPQVVVSKTGFEERFDTWARQRRAVTRAPLTDSQAPVPREDAKRKPKTPPRTPLEESIVGIWKEVLGADDIGTEDSFLDLGGDSLIAVRIIGRLRELSGVTVTPGFFVDDGCTVAGLAREVIATLTALHERTAL